MYSKETKGIVDRREMLRVKIKSLAAEARIIRHEEARSLARRYKTLEYKDPRDGQMKTRRVRYGGCANPIQEELRQHRLRELRFEARAAHLAYGFIRGRTLQQIEPVRTSFVRPPFDLRGNAEEMLWRRVSGLLKKYGPANFIEPECMREKPPVHMFTQVKTSQVATA